MRFPTTPKEGDSVKKLFAEIHAYLRSIRVVGINGIAGQESPNGTSFVIPIRDGNGSSGTTDPCPFGRVVSVPDSDPPEKAIKGGIIYCGDQNWNMDDQPFVLSADIDWLVYIEIEAEVNMDDDSEILLPNVKTGTRPTGDWGHVAWTEGADYPDNTNPSIPGGTGTINVPIGRLTVTDGNASFAPAGCGNITINHCAGTLSHSRG